MDLEQLKHTWKQLDNHLGTLPDNTPSATHRVANGHIATSQRQLARSYRVNAAVGMCMLAMAPACGSLMAFPLWLTIAYAAFGLIIAILSLWFASYIKRCGIISLPVVQAMKLAIRLRRRRMQLFAFSFTAGLTIIISMFVVLFRGHLDAALYGAIAGLAIGGTIGVLKFRRQSALLRTISDELDALS